MQGIYWTIILSVFGCILVTKLTNSIVIDEFPPDDDPHYKPSWVWKALQQDRSLLYSHPVSVYCQPIQLLGKLLTFPGQLCFVSIWSDVTAKKSKNDPRRRFCEKLAFQYNREEQDVCTWWDRNYATCHGKSKKWVPFGYVPTLCPQYECEDFQILHTSFVSTSKFNGTSNQFTHYKQLDHMRFDNYNQSSAFDSSDLGYIRTHWRDFGSNPTIMVSEHQCPNDMIGVSYFYNTNNDRSCTLPTNQTVLKLLIKESNAISTKFTYKDIQKLCEIDYGHTQTQFMGCIYKTYDACINALKRPEILKPYPPRYLQLTTQIFYELFLSTNQTEIDMTERYQKARDPYSYFRNDTILQNQDIDSDETMEEAERRAWQEIENAATDAQDPENRDAHILHIRTSFLELGRF